MGIEKNGETALSSRQNKQVDRTKGGYLLIFDLKDMVLHLVTETKSVEKIVKLWEKGRFLLKYPLRCAKRRMVHEGRRPRNRIDPCA